MENKISLIKEPTKFNQDILKDKCFRMMIFGKSNSGKSTFVIDLLNHNHQNYEYVFFMGASCTYDEYDEYSKNWSFTSHPVKIKSKISAVNALNYIFEKRQKTQIDKINGNRIFKNNKKWLIIWDNVMDESITKTHEFGDCWFSGRHSKIDTIFISQYAFTYIKPSHKEQVTHNVLFNNGSSKSISFYIECIIACLPIEFQYKVNHDILKTIAKKYMFDYIAKRLNGCLICDKDNNKLYYKNREK
jgi:hypothetical protein